MQIYGKLISKCGLIVTLVNGLTMAIFTLTGQDANNTTNAATLVVNKTAPLTFTVNSGAESYFGNDPATTGFNEALDDRISYTNYSGVVINNATFIVTYEGDVRHDNGNSNNPTAPTSHVAIVRITSGPDAGKTYTLIIGTPPPGGHFPTATIEPDRRKMASSALQKAR